MTPLSLQHQSPQLGPEQESVLRDLEQGSRGRFIFVTGKAGTGKSTLLREFVASTRLNVVVVAPTGLAAIQIGGQTIHSFFYFPFGPLTNDNDCVPLFKKGHPKRRLIERLDCIIIDEVSMVRADVLDAIDFSLRINTDCDAPFGGKTVVAFGDLRQLEPVVQSGADASMIQDRFESPFFFDATVLKSTGIDVWQLETVYRQHDPEFLWALERVRLSDASELQYFNDRVNQKLDSDHAVVLTATNSRADSINSSRLNALPGVVRLYKGEKTGTFERDFPADPLLRLKPNAQVMFVKNGKSWANGSIGAIQELNDTSVVVKLDSGETVTVEPEKWEKTRYSWDSGSGRIGKDVVGEYTQLPLRLAWAVTIHKSQGLTLDAAIVDLDVKAFAHGQVYVALSRCRTISGLSMARTLRPEDLIVHPRIEEFERASKLS